MSENRDPAAVFSRFFWPTHPKPVMLVVTVDRPHIVFYDRLGLTKYGARFPVLKPLKAALGHGMEGIGTATNGPLIWNN